MIECCKCDKTGNGNAASLPRGWGFIDSPTIGRAPICPQCLDAEAEVAPRLRGKIINVCEDGTIAPQSLTETTKERLAQYISRLENLRIEKAEVSDRERDVYGDAKALGFDVRAMREIIKIRAKDPKKYMEEQQMLDLYLVSLEEKS
ncbi:MAG: hypothetical protein FD163_2505 [Hyphomonadaceae bacterium]|nr:MAG: hypothetical protein FD128_1688 [Hyphomonadaceae bacterium]KAF0182715.1 MAG: hypothetical protein FD163_2505 [Hyphomonadaceae bacterium]